MTQLAVERIKLFSTRSPYWCLASVLAAALLFAALFGAVDGGRQASTVMSQIGLRIGEMIVMVLAALAVTTEYRFGTIRVSFLAVPRRSTVLGAKTVLVAVVAGVTAAVASLAAFFLTKLLASHPDQPLTLTDGESWRLVLGWAALFPIAAIIALAVGVLIRQSAGAIAIVLVWPMLIEGLITLIPKIGSKVGPWLPFSAGNSFTAPASGTTGFGDGAPVLSSGPTPLEGLGVFAATAVVLWLVALAVLRHRDA